MADVWHTIKKSVRSVSVRGLLSLTFSLQWTLILITDLLPRSAASFFAIALSLSCPATWISRNRLCRVAREVFFRVGKNCGLSTGQRMRNRVVVSVGTLPKCFSCRWGLRRVVRQYYARRALLMLRHIYPPPEQTPAFQRKFYPHNFFFHSIFEIIYARITCSNNKQLFISIYSYFIAASEAASPLIRLYELNERDTRVRQKFINYLSHVLICLRNSSTLFGHTQLPAKTHAAEIWKKINGKRLSRVARSFAHNNRLWIRLHPRRVS